MKSAHFLHYKEGNSLYHQHDARMKLLELSGWSIFTLSTSPATLLSLGLLVSILYMLCGRRLPRRALVFWTIMSLAIIAFSSVNFSPESLNSGESSPGSALPFPLPRLDMATLPNALFRSLRLLLMLMCSHLFISTTSLISISEALRWVSRPLPESWSVIFSLTFTLSLGFVIWLMDSTIQISEAVKSRALSPRHSPLRYAFHISLPLAQLTLRRTEITSDAMLSRNVLNRPRIQARRVSARDFILFLIFLLSPPLTGLAIMSFPGIVSISSLLGFRAF